MVDVSLPWNHSLFLGELEPVDRCETPAIIVSVSHDLYTAQEADLEDLDTNEKTSTMWYVFFTHEKSDITYTAFLNADYFSKEDTILLAQSVRFTRDAFQIEIK